MPVVGTLRPTSRGGWAGPVYILAREVKITLTPNDNQANPKAPAFRISVGAADLGAAWRNKTSEKEPRDFLSADIDFPGLIDPISIAFFISRDGTIARAVWNRRTKEPKRNGDPCQTN